MEQNPTDEIETNNKGNTELFKNSRIKKIGRK